MTDSQHRSHPAARPPPPPPANLPPHIVAYLDDSKNEYYFYNNITGDTSWDPPSPPHHHPQHPHQQHPPPHPNNPPEHYAGPGAPTGYPAVPPSSSAPHDLPVPTPHGYPSHPPAGPANNPSPSAPPPYNQAYTTPYQPASSQDAFATAPSYPGDNRPPPHNPYPTDSRPPPQHQQHQQHPQHQHSQHPSYSTAPAPHSGYPPQQPPHSRPPHQHYPPAPYPHDPPPPYPSHYPPPTDARPPDPYAGAPQPPSHHQPSYGQAPSYPHQPSYPHNPSYGHAPPSHAQHPGYPPMHQPVSHYPPQQQPPPGAAPPSHAGSAQPHAGSNANASYQPFSQTPTYGTGAPVPSYGPGASLAPGAPVNISLEVRAIGLKKKDLLSKSDPICLLLTPNDPLAMTLATKWTTTAKTEAIRNTAAPIWTTRLRLPYHFEQYQPLRFLIVDVDDFKTNSGDTLGHADTTLAHIVRNLNETLPLHPAAKKEKRGPGVMTGPPFRPGGTGEQAKTAGHLIVRSHDEDAAGSIKLSLGLRGTNIPSLDKVVGIVTSKADPFFKLFMLVPNSPHPVALYTSEHFDNNSEPVWRTSTITIPATDQPEDSIQLKAQVYDWNKNRQHALIGTSQFTLAQAVSKLQPFEIVRPNKAPVGHPGRSGKRTPMLHVHEVISKKMPSFVSYLAGGLRLNFMVAVDFTKSNRPVDQRDSLHYLGDHPSAFLQTSQYAQALRAVSSVITPYIGEGGPITALGFGARAPWNSAPHERGKLDFHLGGALGGANNDMTREVFGVDQLLQAYRACAERVELSGPTMFAPVIRTAVQLANLAPMNHAAQVFSVLVIMTDGIVDDMAETIDEIVGASYSTPIAIVIIGIGNANFGKMKRLDGDDLTLKTTSGRRAKHDIVQFCKFESGMRVERLAAEVLQEVPSRVVEFMVDKGLQPMGPEAMAPGAQPHGGSGYTPS